MQYITILDYALLPFVIAFIYLLAYRNRNKKYPPGHPWRKYYIPGLSVKIFGAVFIGLIYQYYYGGGDTFNFFHDSRIINSAFDQSFVQWVNMLFKIPDLYDPAYYNLISQTIYYSDPASYTVCAIAAFISFFLFNTYLPTAVIFAFISFSGVWALFRTFAALYPRLTRPIAFAILFIPSTFVWGSGIFKDSICMFGLGWLTYGVFRMLVQKDFSLKNIILSILSFILIATIKIYIIIGFVPALAIWILFIYTQRVAHSGLRFFIKLLFLAGFLGGFVFIMQYFGAEYLGSYSLDNIEKTAEKTRGWISYVSEKEEGAAYDLGSFDPSIQGMLTKFPQAVNVTLFRPYLWEARKPIIMLSALEAFLFLFLTLKIIFTIGLPKIWRTISANPAIQFCLIFSIFFAFAVGVTTYNFGTLSRYKIPCLPFYGIVLVLLYYRNAGPNKKLIRVLNI